MIKIHYILLQPQNSQSQQCTKMSLLSHKTCQSGMEETHLASERKLDPQEETFGVFSESINSKRLSNLSLLPQRSHGRSSIE